MRNLKSKMAAGPSWIYKILITFTWTELLAEIWTAHTLHTEIRKIHEKCEIYENPRWRRPHLEFTKMLITSAWIELFGWNLNCIYLGITEMENVTRNGNFENPRWAGRHLEFTKMLITSAWMSFLAKIWTAYTLAQQKLENFIRNAEFWNPRWRPPPSWIYKNINNFHVDWAFWLKFELRIPWHNRNIKFMKNAKFMKIQAGAGRYLDLLKC